MSKIISDILESREIPPGNVGFSSFDINTYNFLIKLGTKLIPFLIKIKGLVKFYKYRNIN
jgi:hypothetical protein